MMKYVRKSLWGVGAVLLVLWLVNSSLLIAVPPDQAPKIIAHRGVHHSFGGAKLTGTTCRAGQAAPITHGFIENTLPSMQAAFAAGADVVELDVHLTADGYFAVFHDWTLDCQTDGQGETRSHTMAHLKTLDLGHGITTNGRDFPLRGTAVGMMPTLREVLDADLPGPILINFKSRRAEEGQVLADRLTEQDLARTFAVYGGGPPTLTFLNSVPKARGYDRQSVKACLIGYFSIGWIGRVPPPCQNTIITVPSNYAPFLWGWPHRFTARMKAAGTEVILMGPNTGHGFSSGIDTVDQLAKVPRQFGGYIWTNRVEVIGPLLKQR